MKAGRVRGVGHAPAVRGLVVAVLQIEQLLPPHKVEVHAQLRIDAPEDGGGLLLQFPCVAERFERRSAQGIDLQVPGSQCRHR
jgi:hypothetical protein